MKRNKNNSKISLKKIQITKINDLSLIKGGALYFPISSSDYPTCTKRCNDVEYLQSGEC